MNLEQLKYIVEIADTFSISKAANNLHVSQPNISQSILNLEKELDFKIFNRSRQGVYPTGEGLIFINKAKEILHNVDNLYEIAKMQSQKVIGSLNVIAIPIIGLTILPRTLGKFKLQYPDVQIEVYEDGSNIGIEGVLDGTADISIISKRNNIPIDERIYFEPLFTSKTLAYVGSKSPLAKKKKISFKEIIKYPIVLFNEKYSSHSFMRAQLDQYGEPNIFFTSGNSDAMKKVISESLAVGFYSDISLKMDPYILSNQIVPVRITEEELVYSTYGVATKSKEYQSFITQKFIEELKLQAEDYKRVNNLPDYSK